MRESVAWSIVRFRSNQTGQAIKAGQAEGGVGGMGEALLSRVGPCCKSDTSLFSEIR